MCVRALWYMAIGNEAPAPPDPTPSFCQVAKQVPSCLQCFLDDHTFQIIGCCSFGAFGAIDFIFWVVRRMIRWNVVEAFHALQQVPQEG